MENKIVKTMIGAVALSSAAMAGPVAEVAVVPVTNGGDFCDTLKSFGTLYKNKDNPFIQEVKIFGRTQFTYANVNGETSSGDDFSESYEEVRRARVGTKITAFNGLELLFRANMVTDRKPVGGDRDWGYKDFDVAIISYNFGTVAGIEDFKLSYGRLKVAVSAEAQQSSKKIKTVERSAISNRVFRRRYTGLLASGSRGNVNATIGLLSLDRSEFVGNWDAGNALFLDSTVELGGHDYQFDALYNLDEGSTADDQVRLNYLFASSLATEREIAGWNVLFNVIYGDNGEDSAIAETGGAFWGLVIEPSKFIVEDKVEAVFRYQYQGSSEAKGISALRRYFGQGLSDAGSGIRGDQHHSIYAGLNYFFCGHNSKIMVGAEYENLSTPDGSASGTTLWAAYRMYF
jgi:hypothetical protein